jgi:hypothetical protein
MDNSFGRLDIDLYTPPVRYLRFKRWCSRTYSNKISGAVSRHSTTTFRRLHHTLTHSSCVCNTRLSSSFLSLSVCLPLLLSLSPSPYTSSSTQRLREQKGSHSFHPFRTRRARAPGPRAATAPGHRKKSTKLKRQNTHLFLDPGLFSLEDFDIPLGYFCLA